MEAHFIKITPVQDGIKRPLWSVVIPTYNCAEFLKETLRSVLFQDPGEDQMEILVVDDHSTKDNPEAVVQQFGNGRVQFIRQPENVGKVRNYETGLKASKGYFIHQLHGDDMVRPEFYKTMASLLKNHPEAMAAFCRSLYIDSKGRWTGMTGMIQEQDGIVPAMAAKLYTEQHIQTPSMVVKREVYEKIGTFDRRLNCMEDWEMWIRIANSFPMAASNEVLSLYRIHNYNATSLTFMDGSALKTQRLLFNLVDNYIEPGIKKRFMMQRRKKQAAFWLMSYKSFQSQLRMRQRLLYLKFILKLDFSLKNIYNMLK